MQISYFVSRGPASCLRVRRAVAAASSSLGVRMYRRYAALFHRPRVIISESSSPAWTAAVAAPIRKLWPAKWSGGRPKSSMARLVRSTNFDFVSGAPSGNTKKGPAAPPLLAINAETAATGHSSSPVLPITTSTPLPNWSDFERRRRTLSTLAWLGRRLPRPPMTGASSRRTPIRMELLFRPNERIQRSRV